MDILIDNYIMSLYQDLEDEVIADIVRRVKKTGRYTETAELMAKSMHEQGYSPAKIQAEVMKTLRADKAYQMAVAENTKAYKQEIQDIIDETVKAAKEANDILVAEAGNMAWNNDLSMWEQYGEDLIKPNNMSQLISAARAQTMGALKNLTKTMGFKNTNLGTTGVLNAYQRELDLALIKVSTGTFSFDQAVNECVHRLAQSGLRSIDYANGRTYQIDTAVRMNIRTGMSQLAGKVMEENLKSSGQDLVITSQHMGSRPEHAPWQNKVFSYSGKSKKYPDFFKETGYGTLEGLKGANCTHDFYPFWEGASVIPEDIVEPEPVEIDGKEYDYYQATQKQRQMERNIRATKRELEAQSRLGGSTTELRSKLKAQTDEYKRFSRKAGLKVRDNRLRVEKNTSSFTKTNVYKKMQKKEIASRESQYKEYLSSLSMGDITLRKKHKEMLSKVPQTGDWNYFRNKEIGTEDLAALTAATGDEFALFSGKNGKIAIHGNSMKWSIPEDAWKEISEKQMIWVSHSHPTITNLMESPEDIETLKLFTWQEKSSIIDLNGNVKEFDADMQRWFNEMLGVK